MENKTCVSCLNNKTFNRIKHKKTLIEYPFCLQCVKVGLYNTEVFEAVPIKKKSVEKFVGDTWDRKNFEYVVVGKVKHETEDFHVYLVTQREFGTEKYEYYVEQF